MNISKIIVATLILMLATTFASANDNEDENGWNIYSAKVFVENDVFAGDDSQYSSGNKLDFIFHVNNPDSFLYDMLISSDEMSDTLMRLQLQMRYTHQINCMQLIFF